MPDVETGPVHNRAPNPETCPVEAVAAALQDSETSNDFKETNSVNELKEQALKPDTATIGKGIAMIGLPNVLCTISPDPEVGKPVGPSQRFEKGEEAEATEWACKRSVEGFNVYWHPNSLKDGVSAKASKCDILAARFVHADIDPAKGAAGWTAKEKTEKLDDLNGLDCQPSFVIDSGNGIHAYWRLDGDCANLESIENINKGVVAAIGGDKVTYDVSRLLRVPGTLNYPTAKKVSAGRVVTLATILSADTGEVYEPETLRSAFPTGANVNEAAADRPRVSLSDVVPITCDSLGMSAHSSARRAVERPAGKDRSAEMHHAACELVRDGWDDTRIAGLLINEANPVSAHAHGQPDPMRAVRRAIEAARINEPDSIVIPDKTRKAVARMSDIMTAKQAATSNDNDATAFTPVDLWQRHEAPELPQRCLPPILETYSSELGKVMGADPAGLAMSALAVCAAVIDDAIIIQPKAHEPHWKESARLWIGLVGQPSTKKSPIMAAAIRPLRAIDARLAEDNESALRNWELPDKSKRGPCPPQPRRIVQDTTIEALQMVLRDNREGVLSIQDELSGWFGAMDKYTPGKGSAADRAFWLQAYNGGSYSINRVGRGASFVPNLSVCLLGGIQPEPLRKIAGDSIDDGLIQRFVPVVLRPATVGQDTPESGAVKEYADLIQRLGELSAPSSSGNLQQPIPLCFDDLGRKVRETLERENVELVAALERTSPKLSAHFGKHDGLFARLCVTFHCVEHAYCAALPPIINVALAERVAQFIRDYLRPSAIAFYSGVLGMSAGHEDLMALANLIVADGLVEIAARDVQRSTRAMRHVSADEVRRLCEKLQAFGWLTPIEHTARGAAPRWHVNRAVHSLFASRGKAEAKRRENERATLCKMFA